MDDFKFIKKTRASSSTTSAFAAVSTHTVGKEKHRRISITIYERLMRQMRWCVGDYAVVGINPQGLMMVKKSTRADGYRLSATQKGPKEGDFANCSFSFPVPHDFPCDLARHTLLAEDDIDISRDSSAFVFVYPAPLVVEAGTPRDRPERGESLQLN